MLQELLYTSHQGEGLKKGTGGGFCTVLSSNAMAPNLAQALEKLSGYKHPFDAHDPRAVHNPVNYRFCSLRIGGKAYHVFSRISDYRAEHTGRTNKLAHHLVADAANRPACGPAVILASPLMRSDWDSVPRLVPPLSDSALSLPEAMATACETWKRVAGDAGWAGAVAEKLMSSEDRPVSVIYPGGAEPLDLIAELLALLPAEHRWSIPFSTYFTTLPPGTSCRLRFFLDDTQEAIAVRRDFRQETIDLTNARTALTSTKFTDAARAGIAFPISRTHQSTALGVRTPRDERDRLDFALQSVEASEDDLTLIPEIRGAEPDARLLPPPIRESAVTRPLRSGKAPPEIPGDSRNPRRKDRFGVGFIAGIAVGLLLGVCFSYMVLLNTRPPRTVDLAESKLADQNESKLADQKSETIGLSPEEHKSPESSSAEAVDASDPKKSDSEVEDADGVSQETKLADAEIGTSGQEGVDSDAVAMERSEARQPRVVEPPPLTGVAEPEQVQQKKETGFSTGKRDQPRPSELQVVDIDWNLNESPYGQIDLGTSGVLRVNKSLLHHATITINPDLAAFDIDSDDADLLRNLRHAIFVLKEVGSESQRKWYQYCHSTMEPNELDVSKIGSKILGLDNIKSLRLRYVDSGEKVKGILLNASKEQVLSFGYSEKQGFKVQFVYSNTKLGEVELAKPASLAWSVYKRTSGPLNNAQLTIVSSIGEVEKHLNELDASTLLQFNDNPQNNNDKQNVALPPDVIRNIKAWDELKEEGGIEFLKRILSKPIIEAYIPADESRSLPERVVARYSIELEK